MPQFLTYLLLSTLLAFTPPAPLVPSPQAFCKADEWEANLNCPNCTTLLAFDCSTSFSGDCAGCAYTYSASITCAGGTGDFVSGGASLECGESFEKRFGGCWGTIWGAAKCTCESCPQ